MGSRGTESKRMKLKTWRRSLPKSFEASYIPVGRGPNREVMAQYKESSRSLAFDNDYLQWLETVTRFRGIPPGRVEAREAAERIRNARVQPSYYLSVVLNEMPMTWARIKDICPMLMNIVLEDTMVRHVRMFWHSDRKHFILLELHHVGRYMRASMVYQDDKRLKERFKSDTVRWVEFVSSSPPKPEDG